MSPERFRLIQEIAAAFASPAREFPKRDPDEHGPEEDCRGLCGAQRCIDRELAVRPIEASP